jgi:GxxExxY protein
MATFEPNPTVDRILACAIRVHRTLGPGLLESAYEQCLAHEFAQHEIRFRRQVGLPVTYAESVMPCGFRVDFLVEEEVLLELKAVERLLPLHDAQALTYLKISGLPRALVINFNVRLLKAGVRSYLRRDQAARSGPVPQEAEGVGGDEE